jgi:CRP/FNR family cyclic AMP-dependent transcriptional regulator
MENTAEAKKLLENSRLFKGFSPSVIEAILPLLTACHFEAGKLICLKGEPSDCLYIIRAGEVEISVSSREGKIILLGTLSDGDVFGEVGLLDKKSRTANATAKSDVSLYRLGSNDFDTITKLFGHGELMALTSYICFLFRRVTNNLEETVFMDAGIRIARKIQELYEKSDDKKDNRFKVAISQENLGRMAGLSREATNKALSRLEETGLIERKYKRISIPDVEKFLQTMKQENESS